MTGQHASASDDAGLRGRLNADLTAAMKRRDRPAVAVIRTLLGAIGNREAVVLPDGPYDPTVGLGSDVPRRFLDESDLLAILDEEIDAHRTGAEAAEVAGRTERAAGLRAELEVLLRYRTDV